MTKEEVFLLGIKNKNYMNLEWIQSVYCTISEGMDDYKEDAYPFRIVQRMDGIYYLDEDLALKKIDTKDLLVPEDKVTITSDILPNVSKPITTTTGNVLLNAICVVYPFGNKIPFQEGVMTIPKLEDLIVEKLVDDENVTDTTIPVKDYLKFTEAILYLRQLADVFVPGASAKSMTPPDGVTQLKKQLLEEYKDDLDNPTTLVKIDEKLKELDEKYLADDDDAQGFMLSKKLKNEARRKLYLMVGGESGFSDDNTKVDAITASLVEGVKIEDLPKMYNGGRAGSYNRGYETMNGGAQFKKLLRAAVNTTIKEDDCGTTLGITKEVTKANHEYFIGFSIIENKKTIKLTEENIQQYIGKHVVLRSPMYCKTEGTHYCKACLGDKLSLHPNAVSIAVSDIGSVFLLLFMKKMHVSSLSKTKLDINTLIS